MASRSPIAAGSQAAEVRDSQPRNNDAYRTERYEKQPGERIGHAVRLDGFDPVAERKKKDREDNERADVWKAAHPEAYEAIVDAVAMEMARDFDTDAPASMVKATGEARILKRILAELVPKITEAVA